MIAKPKQGARGGLDILEEAVGLLRDAPASALLIYLMGAVPFLLAMLFFFSDMTRSPFARERLGEQSLLVAVLFIWKRIWQAVFAAQLHERMSGRGVEPGNLARLTAIQCALQPLRAIALPVCLLATVPLPWAVAFFRNVGLFAAMGDPDPVGTARRQASLWGRQNWIILSVAFGAWLVLFLNVMVVLFLIPQLGRSFLGIEGLVAKSGPLIFNNITFAAAGVLAWLAIDPLLEAAYVLRAFYGASVTSGEDLRAALQRVAALVALVVMMLSVPAMAQQPVAPANTIDSGRLDRSIDEVIHRREFTWRSARAADPDVEKEWPGWFQSAVRAVRKAIDWLDEKIKKWFESNRRENSVGDKGGERPPIELWSAALALALVAGIVALFLRRRRAKPADATPVSVPVTAVNLADDSVTADQLPESSWLQLAQEWLGKGDYRLAMRALYLAGLKYLGERGLVSIRKSKTGLEYGRELERRARASSSVLPEVAPIFRANNELFERGWYGQHVVDREQVEAFAAGLDEVRRCAPH
jgi:hypothetical protein